VNDSWRLIIDEPLDAAANMARDEALLRAVQRGAATTLRFYAWRPWAFSLGYFQNWADFEAHAERGVPIVRRLTGGGAIWHADELTYSLVGPFGREGFPQRAADIFEKVHKTIVEGLAGLGVSAELSDAPTGRSATICFAKPQKLDIVVGGRKLLGSAQRRYGGWFLQHGSLPLSPNEYAPGAISIFDILVNPAATDRIIETLTGAFERAFEVNCAPGALTTEEAAEAAELAIGKYAGAKWNRRR
jgi:lipoyl(octanoyl) transferase